MGQIQRVTTIAVVQGAPTWEQYYLTVRGFEFLNRIRSATVGYIREEYISTYGVGS